MFLINNLYFNLLLASLTLPIAYHNVDYVALLYPIFLCRTLHLLKDANFKKRFFLGFIHSALNGLLGFYWINYVIADFGHIPAPYNYILSFLFCVLLPCYHLILPFLWPAFGLSLLMVGELLPRFFPWYIGSRIGDPFMQLASVVGAPGLTAIAVLATSIFLSRLKTTGLLVFLGGFAILGYLSKPQISNQAIFKKIAVVQPNIGNFEKLESESSPMDVGKRVLEKFLNLSPTGADLVVWPETSFPSYYPESTLSTRLNDFIKTELKTPLVFGAYEEANNKEYSTAFYVNEKAEIKGRYYKYALMPFGEYLPSYLEWARDYAPTIGNLSPGDKPKALTIDDTNILITLCLEGTYSWALQKSFSGVDTANKYNLHLNLTNDSWYGPSIERYQHLQLLQIRAIEHRTPIVRATNDGISALIYPDGKIVHQTEINEQAQPIYSVPLEKRVPTVFELEGKFIHFFLCLVIVLFDLTRFFYTRYRKRLIDQLKVKTQES